MIQLKVFLNFIILLGVMSYSAISTADPEIIRFWLVDAETNTRITELVKHQRLTLPFLPSHLSIEAEANGETQSVIMKIDNVETSTENLVPYSLDGDNNGNFVPVPELRGTGWILISARPFSADNGGGIAGEKSSIPLFRYQPDFLVNNTADIVDYDPGDGYCTVSKPLVITDELIAAANRNPGINKHLVKGIARNKNLTASRKTSKNLPKETKATHKVTVPNRPFQVLDDFKPNPGAIKKGCTLRAAIEEANALPGSQSILIDGTLGDYQLVLGQLEITEGVTIRGHEMPLIDANHHSRIFRVDGGGNHIIVNMEGLDIARGKVSFDERGGAISIKNNALLQLSDSVVRESKANVGGGIYLDSGADLTVTRSAIRDNIAVTPETFDGGGITQRGGGISIQDENSVTTIRHSSIFDNLAARGGGISNFAGTLKIENSSVIDNEALALGGGIENQAEGKVYMTFATIVNNKAGTSPAAPENHRVAGGLYNNGLAFMANSVLAENSDDWTGGSYHSPDCHSPNQNDFKSYRNNVVGVLNENCQFTDYSWGNHAWIEYGTDASPLDPGLSGFQISKGQFKVDLAYYSPIETSILLSSATTQSSSLYECPNHDMLGSSRPTISQCDIGAIEIRDGFIVPNQLLQ